MKLLVLDVEGTLFRTQVRLPGTSLDSTVWQSLAATLGDVAIQEEIATHRRWGSGEYRSYLDWMKDTVRMHVARGLTEQQFLQVIDAAEYHPGVREVLRGLDRDRFEPVLVSGGFRELARRVQVDCRVVHAFAACEYLFDAQGRLAAFNLLPCDFAGKLDFVALMLREYGLSPSEWLFVGDGRNDVQIAKAAPFSVGFRPHPDLAAVTSKNIEDFRELLDILKSI